MTENVVLIGGYFDGETHEVDVTRTIVTFSETVEVIDRDGYIDGQPLLVPRLVIASYRRRDRTTFVYCGTQTGLGHPCPDLPETQLRIEVEDDD